MKIVELNKQEEKIKEFVKLNYEKLTFVGSISAVNSSCTIITGYADFIGLANDIDGELSIIRGIEAGIGQTLEGDVKEELSRVFDFTYRYNYGNWWKSRDAKREYQF